MLTIQKGISSGAPQVAIGPEIQPSSLRPVGSVMPAVPACVPSWPCVLIRNTR